MHGHHLFGPPHKVSYQYVRQVWLEERIWGGKIWNASRFLIQIKTEHSYCLTIKTNRHPWPASCHVSLGEEGIHSWIISSSTSVPGVPPNWHYNIRRMGIFLKKNLLHDHKKLSNLRIDTPLYQLQWFPRRLSSFFFWRGFCLWGKLFFRCVSPLLALKMDF